MPAPLHLRSRLISLLPGPWRMITLAGALLVAVPVTALLMSALSPTGDIWEHLVSTVLIELLINTAWLVGGVALGTALLGTSLAWLTAVYEFPGRRVLSWALMLPLAVPTYVLAFVFIGTFDFSGPVQSTLRSWFGSGFVLPDVRSTGGVIAVMSLALYPYVYLLSRNAFLTQGKRAMEAANSLGHGRLSGLFRVALPMARPWIAGGVILVVMEALADFGAVSIFNYDTFTTAIYKSWFGFFSLSAAAQLSSILVLIVFVVIAVEQRSRSARRFHTAGRADVLVRVQLKGLHKWAATAYASAVLFIAFIVPLLVLGSWCLQIYAEEFTSEYLRLTAHSLLLGLCGALLIATGALGLSYARRRTPGRLSEFLVTASTLGYALPGTVLAVGVFIPIAGLDNLIAETGLSFSLKGTLPVLIVAYAVRFMAAGYNAIDSAMHRITTNIDEAARLMGVRGLRILSRVYLPLIRGGMATAALLVLVDIMKEMPITLMMRPFGWDTLAVKIFELTSEGQWERAALPATALVFAGIIPVILLSRQGDNNK